MATDEEKAANLARFLKITAVMGLVLMVVAAVSGKWGYAAAGAVGGIGSLICARLVNSGKY